MHRVTTYCAVEVPFGTSCFLPHCRKAFQACFRYPLLRQVRFHMFFTGGSPAFGSARKITFHFGVLWCRKKGFSQAPRVGIGDFDSKYLFPSFRIVAPMAVVRLLAGIAGIAFPSPRSSALPGYAPPGLTATRAVDAVSPPLSGVSHCKLMGRGRVDGS